MLKSPRGLWNQLPWWFLHMASTTHPSSETKAGRVLPQIGIMRNWWGISFSNWDVVSIFNLNFDPSILVRKISINTQIRKSSKIIYLGFIKPIFKNWYMKQFIFVSPHEVKKFTKTTKFCLGVFLFIYFQISLFYY